ncbi:MAG: signal peptidase II [Nanoarchaeota archaeon]
MKRCKFKIINNEIFKKYLSFFIIGFIILIIDQLSKFFIRKLIVENEHIYLIDNFFSLTHVYNTGAAFSLFSENNNLLLVFGLIIIFFMIYYVKNIEKKYLIALSLIFGGALSNLIDRFIFNGVVDFINFNFWPIFNFADSFITIGIIIMSYIILKEEFKKK